MDRREALKKMAVGGATVVGVSTIATSVAFANPGTSDCSATIGNPTVTFTNSGNGSNQTVTITFQSIGSIVCRPAPCTSGGGPATLVGPPTWTFNGTTVTALSVTSANNINNSVQYPWTITFRVRCLDRKGRPVCATYTGGGNVFMNANIFQPNPPAQPTGTLAYSASVCPAT